ncbi:NAD(P)-binding protein, partial [Pseudomonadota bacterium]
MKNTTTTNGEARTFRAFTDGDLEFDDLQESIFDADYSHKCPVYVHRTPPCQGNCPAGEDVRGWLQIVHGIEKPSADQDWQDYAFYRATDANPFPSIMGRVCPAPCEVACNRKDVEGHVGINAVEQFIGDTAHSRNLKFADAPRPSGKRVAIIGGGPAGLSAAYHLRRMGHGSTIFEASEQLGGLMRYGIPGYRIPRQVLQHEIQRILDLGDIEVRVNSTVGEDIQIKQLEDQYDAILWAIGCQKGRALPVENADAPNCVTGLDFLDAFNKGKLSVTAKKVVCIGGGDTSIDVVSVTRRVGTSQNREANAKPERIISGELVANSKDSYVHEPGTVTLTSLFKKTEMTAAEHEVEDAIKEGVTILNEVMPLEVMVNDEGRAVALKMAECDMKGDQPIPRAGTEFEIECDLIVSAIGQFGDLSGINELDNGKGFIDSDALYQIPERAGHFVAGDIVRPHLLTTAIGQASIAASSINQYLTTQQLAKRPKIDVHHFNLLEKLKESGLQPAHYNHGATWGTATESFAVHNYENRAANQTILSDKLHLAHFDYQPRNSRREVGPDASNVHGHFLERRENFDEETVKAEAGRCMSCGMCFECDNCVIYCPQ